METSDSVFLSQGAIKEEKNKVTVIASLSRVATALRMNFNSHLLIWLRVINDYMYADVAVTMKGYQCETRKSLCFGDINRNILIILAF